MQFNRDETGSMTPLPKPSIDTGMGLERIAAVIQGAPTNYETDLFMPIIKRIESLSGCRLGGDRASDIAMKVIADHSRAAAFLVGDGVLPSNEGPGYVLRRILRRAIRYGRNISLVKPFLHETVAAVFEAMRSAYPELAEARAFITNVIKNEEMRFSETLDNGLKLLHETLDQMRKEGRRVVEGEVMFKLYDTYGFPVDIVRDVVRDMGLDLDMEGFNAAMDRRRKESRTISAFSNISDAYREFIAGLKKPIEFVGYDRLSCEATVLLLVRAVEIATEPPRFYAASGGQVGDCGKITGPGVEVEVFDTVKDPTGLIIHKGRLVSGTIHKGDHVRLSVDGEKRRATAANHTATHLLHAALRKTLGEHVRQAGSHVGPERLRFDFTHFSQIDREALDRIETLVNDRIRENIAVSTEEMPAAEAFQSGAMALFEEKYGDRVRVVTLDTFSKELCGGTHAARTGDIGFLKILGESSVASGVRRIEALTGRAALAYVQSTTGLLAETAGLLKERPEGVYARVQTLMAHQRSLEKELEGLKLKMAATSADHLEDDIRSVNGIKVISKKVEAQTPAALRDLADRFKDRLKSGIVVLGASAGDKALLIAVVTKDLLDRYHAGRIIKAVAAEVGGSGGGRPDMAQAGGTQPENLDRAMEKVFSVVESPGRNN